jgi:uncharacterized protein (TIGR02466 family)
MNKIELFTTPVVVFTVDFHEEICGRIIHFSNSNFFPWKKQVSLWDIKDRDPAIARLHDFYLDCASQYCNSIFNTEEFLSDSFSHVMGWINTNSRNGWTRPHNHRATELTGTYYVKVPDNSGSLMLVDPRPGLDWIRHNDKDYTENMYEIKPKDGQLIMFPGWLLHYVDINRSSEERISLTSNINIKR